MYPLPNGTGYFASDLNTSQKVEQLFNYCQILEASIFEEGWLYLLQHYGIDQLHLINQRSGWFEEESVTGFRQTLLDHFADIGYSIPKKYLQ
ncbi:hypothetical protein [Hymenobacter pini]|uniref:hypothetical protein n=1 Tax=Hymenobacter pini TaxID=2880879 RepID=UPI001CF2A4CB|nr:hypothetical protein [Hymenobacter pini]MCA8833152.1 hypothetical protein [Hymenobacter pini]